MLINSKNLYTGKVKFVSYTGKFPNLCSGVLTLNIDGKEVKFGHAIEEYDWQTRKYKDDNYNSFWKSGGSIDSDYYPHEGEWIINISEIPEQYRKYASEIDEVFNDNVPYGCCGGCV